MKQWPEDETETVSFEELIKHLNKVIQRNVEIYADYKFSPYEGYDIGNREKTCSFSPDYSLSPEGIKYHEERDRDIISVVLGIAIQLGIEQGRRISNKEFKVDRLLLATYEKLLGLK